MQADLVLSSGFLAFARQAGFLMAVEESEIEVTGVCGTSSGALASALWLSGLSASQVAHELSVRRPLSYLRPTARPWRGAFSLQGLIAHLEQFLAPTFADLPVPFGVGTMSPEREPILITEGPLAPAVAASCAIPGLFAPVRLGDRVLQDGGMVDRLFLDHWRGHRGGPSTVVHLVDRSGGAPTEPRVEDGVVVRTPRSYARLWSLGDFDGQLHEARGLADAALATWRPPINPPLRPAPS